MFIATDRDHLHKIVILNPKGGSGKTTLATNIAGYYAIRGPAPMLVDCDPHGFSKRWVEKRPGFCPEVDSMAAYEETTENTGTVYVETRPETEKVIIDLPAMVDHSELLDVTYGANNILIPVMPSEIDVYCLSRFVAELLLIAQIDRSDCQVAVVANRTRENNKSYKVLMRFLFSLRIPLIAVLRDSQNYVHAADRGLCIYELPAHRTMKDITQMDFVMEWLDRWRTRQPDSTASQAFARRTPDPVIISSRIRQMT